METPYNVSKTVTENTEGSKAEAEGSMVCCSRAGDIEHLPSAGLLCTKAWVGPSTAGTEIQEKLFYTQHYSSAKANHNSNY